MLRFSIMALAAIAFVGVGTFLKAAPGRGPMGGPMGGPQPFMGDFGPPGREFAPPDFASEPPTPEQVAQRAIHRMTRIAHMANVRMHVVTNVGVNIINQLQANDHAEQAANVAENRTNRVNQIADNNSDRIQFVVEHAIEVLTDLGAAEELIAQVQTVAEEKWTLIEQHRTDEVQRIEDALND